MLAIRLQRTGRKGHAQFRIIVQDARRTPTSGAIVYQLGYYNPHAKTTSVDKEKANFYLEHGAQPSDRVARLLKNEGVKLPAWVKLAADKSRTTRHPEKLRKNQPAAPAMPDAPAEDTAEAAEPAEKADVATTKTAEPTTQTESTPDQTEPETQTPTIESEDVAVEAAQTAESEKVADEPSVEAGEGPTEKAEDTKA